MAYATIRIAGPAPRSDPRWFGVVDPDEITALLGIMPTKQRRVVNAKGECIDGHWSLSFEHAVRSNSLVPHLVWLLDQIEPHVTELRRYLQGRDVLADIFCLWSIVGNQGLILSPELLSRLAATGLRLDIDAYEASEPPAIRVDSAGRLSSEPQCTDNS
jgi:hypothetical protein